MEDKFELLKRNTLGSRMLMKRNEYSISRGVMAKKLNISIRTLWKYEHDESLPDPYQLFTLVKLYNVTFNWFLNGDNK